MRRSQRSCDRNGQFHRRATSTASQETGEIHFRLETFGHDSQLLFQSMVLGLEEMERNYSEYIDLIFKEV